MTAAVTNDIWVFIDLRNRRFFGLSLNVLCKARQLAPATGGKVTACMLATAGAALPALSEADSCVLTETAETECLRHGADRVVVLENALFTPLRVDLFAPALAGAVTESRPGLVLFALSDLGRELAARASRLCHAGLIADCKDLRVDPGGRVDRVVPGLGGQHHRRDHLRAGLGHRVRDRPAALLSGDTGRHPVGRGRAAARVRRFPVPPPAPHRVPSRARIAPQAGKRRHRRCRGSRDGERQGLRQGARIGGRAGRGSRCHPAAGDRPLDRRTTPDRPDGQERGPTAALFNRDLRGGAVHGRDRRGRDDRRHQPGPGGPHFRDCRHRHRGGCQRVPADLDRARTANRDASPGRHPL